MENTMDYGYKIEFAENSTNKFKDAVLKTIIDFHNRGKSAQLGVIAEMNLAICDRNDASMTATFIHVGF